MSCMLMCPARWSAALAVPLCRVYMCVGAMLALCMPCRTIALAGSKSMGMVAIPGGRGLGVQHKPTPSMQILACGVTVLYCDTCTEQQMQTASCMHVVRSRWATTAPQRMRDVLPPGGTMLCKASVRRAGRRPYPFTKAPSAPTAKPAAATIISAMRTRRCSWVPAEGSWVQARGGFTPAEGCPWSRLAPWECRRPPPSCSTGTPVAPKSVPPKSSRA